MTDAEAQTERQTVTSVVLTDDELRLLNDACSPKVQTAVDAALARIAARDTYGDLGPALAGFVADVVTEARTNGRLVYQRASLRTCALCGKQAGYVVYKSGPRRGKPNYDRPLHIAGKELARRFVVVKGHASVGGCTDCVEAVLPTLVEALRGVPAAVPKELRADGEPVRVRYDRRRCSKCGWEGHEGEMGRLRTMMGDGTYPGKCPACGTEHQPFRPSPFESLDGFDIVEATDG